MSTPLENPKPDLAIGPREITRSIPDAIARRVWVAAGGRCTFCNRWLLGDEFTAQPVFIGQLAHIVGWTENAGSPRGQEPLDVHLRNEADNLMLLCYDQHRVIDNKSLWDVYEGDSLRRIKKAHELRIRRLTGLGRERQTAVLRVVGTIHGAPVQVASAAVVDALLEQNMFPSYVLEGVDEYEVDLRGLPGESSGDAHYWDSVIPFIRSKLTRLGALVEREEIVSISVFALARVPVLVALGALLDDTVPTTVYPKRRGVGEGWGWPQTSPAAVDFDWHVLDEGPVDGTQVTVIFSVSGPVQLDRLPDEIRRSTRIIEIRPIGSPPNFDLIKHSTAVEAFAVCWRAVLSDVETRPHVERVNLIPAVPTTVAVAIGRSINASVHPPMIVYDRVGDPDTYVRTLEVPR